jgi:hypothetical protein
MPCPCDGNGNCKESLRLNLRQAGAQQAAPLRIQHLMQEQRQRRPPKKQKQAAATNSTAKAKPGIPRGRDGPLQSRKVRGLFGAQGVHYVYAGGAGCWEYGRYYRGG